MCVCVSVHHVHACCLWRPEDGVRSPGTGVRDGYGPLCGCWKLKSGPLQERPLLLTSESSLVPRSSYFMSLIIIFWSLFSQQKQIALKCNNLTT